MNKLTIFESDQYGKDIQAAIKSLITGKTPITEVRKRDSRGGEISYVNGYYMFRQASLITGFRWSSKCLREKYIPDETAPVEVGALMQVTLYDQAGNHYSHQSWGSSEVKRRKSSGEIISLFDDLKAAYTEALRNAYPILASPMTYMEAESLITSMRLKAVLKYLLLILLMNVLLWMLISRTNTCGTISP